MKETELKYKLLLEEKEQELDAFRSRKVEKQEVKTEKVKMVSDIKDLIREYRKTSRS